jgi:hypothetical protein
LIIKIYIFILWLEPHIVISCGGTFGGDNAEQFGKARVASLVKDSRKLSV